MSIAPERDSLHGSGGKKMTPEVQAAAEKLTYSRNATFAETRLVVSELIKSDEAITKAVDLAVKYGGIDGDHHKAWVIDQMVRALAGDGYAKVVAEAKAGTDGPDTYGWDEGTAP
jgi:hypothetical protein